MADETRHAAWQTERLFAVRLLPEEGEPRELADGLGDFLEAVDFAVEWLAREDPERTGTASLAIFETSADGAEKVWAYPPDASADGAPLMKIFGFDPVNWKAASSEYTPKEPALGTFFTRAPEGMVPAGASVASAAPPPAPEPAVPVPVQVTVPQPAVVAAAAVEPRPVPIAAPRFAAEHEEPAESSHAPLRPRRALAAAWHDPVARSFLFLAGISLWLAVAFSDAEILAFVLVAVSGLWWRRDKLIHEATTDGEDWI